MNDNLKLLFCEQNPDVMEGCRHFFSRKGVNVRFCEKDGNILLDKITTWQPDVVFCDVFLTGMDAIEVRRQAQLLPQPPQLFFATCGYDNEETISRVMKAGFNYCFIKPYSFEVAYARTKMLLDMHSIEQTRSLAKTARHVNLGGNPGFNEHYMDQMFFPEGE